MSYKQMPFKYQVMQAGGDQIWAQLRQREDAEMLAQYLADKWEYNFNVIPINQEGRLNQDTCISTLVPSKPLNRTR